LERLFGYLGPRAAAYRRCDSGQPTSNPLPTNFLPQRPSLIDNATRELAPPAPAESRVSVQVHPGPVKAVLGEIEEAQREQEGREEPEDSER